MSRLAWFPFFVDDYLGGTHFFSAEEHGTYILLLCAQWASGPKQRILNDSAYLDQLLHTSLTRNVRAKFTAVSNGKAKYLRNERLADEWRAAQVTHSKRVKAAHARWSKA